MISAADIKDALEFVVPTKMGNDDAICSACLYKYLVTLTDIFDDIISTEEKGKVIMDYAQDLVNRIASELSHASKNEDQSAIQYSVLDFETHCASDEIKEPCTYCGVGRRWVLNRKARELGATKLAVGHNLDDEVQSVLLNYMRGDLPRASRMGPVTDWSRRKKFGEKFVPRIKPLRELPEKEIALYVLLKGYDIKWDECPYASGVRFDDDLNKQYLG